ncbi:MAG: chromosomal replication initiator protein DnaA [Candidatus Sumerlaeaceae bacterium]|nr:chromosomal replication initiator protein DnaA [Candidatus Sumerlaeaceae bacterium]
MEESVDQGTWEKALARLKGTIDEESYSTWLRPAKFDGVRDNCIHLTVPSLFYKNWLQANYKDKIVRALRQVTDRDLELDFQIAPQGDLEVQVGTDSAALGGIAAERLAQRATEAPRSSLLNTHYTFDQFVVGESNRFAHAACRQVADPASKSYNPLFIYGGVGLGKTHLMHAIGHQFVAASQNLRVLYVSSEQFMNSFIESISQGKQFEFRDFYRSVDLLMIDDVQFFSGKERTQTEFFHTFNALYDAGKKIVVSSDRPPRDLTTLEDRLRTRFSWGLVVDIQAPDLETRLAILRKKALADKSDVPGEVMTYIAERVTSNIRELEGVLIRLKAYSVLHKVPISLELAREVLGGLLQAEQPKDISLDEIMEEVCAYFELKRSDLTGTNRQKKYSAPRHIAQYLSRKLTSLSYPEIADKFGGRDHTSVMHAVRKVEDDMRDDENIKNLVAFLAKRIRGNRESAGQ